MKRVHTWMMATGFVIVATGSALAQNARIDRTIQNDSVLREHASVVPRDARPPKGMCRVWIDGVPAAQQPAPSECSVAVKNRPPNSRIIFGDDYSDSSEAASNARSRLPRDVKGFTGVKPTTPPTTPPTTRPKRPPE